MGMKSVTLLGKDLDFVISDTDDSADTKYYGFLERGKSWYIMREITSAGSYRYVRGDSDYATAWTNRANQVYNYYDVEF